MTSHSTYQALSYSTPLCRLSENDDEVGDRDIETFDTNLHVHDDGDIKRGLQQRHLTMIALAGMIGTGLFLSSGKALAQAGPLGCVLGFVTMGVVTACVAYSAAEMAAFKPVSGGFVRHATMWIDKSTGITTGWNFWYSMAITMPAEISAATTLVGFWVPDVNVAIPITVCWVAISAVNLAPVRFYGEFEFYFAFCKVALIIGLIVGGLILNLGGIPGQERLGFRYWQEPYPLFYELVVTGPAGRFLAFWSTMISAAFAYGNVQVVAIAGAETWNPRQAIPAAVKRTFVRVVLFYVASIFVISIIVPADDKNLGLTTGTAAQSPFVIAFNRAGVKTLPSVVNAVILTSAFSSGNSCTFLASRTLHGLALDGHAPKVFLRLNRYGVPWVAVMASAAWGAVAYLSVNEGSFQAFTWLVALVTTAGIISWVILCITYLRFFHALRVQGISRDALPYKSPLQPYITYFALIMNSLVLVFSGWTSFVDSFEISSFLSNYLDCIIFPVFYGICKLWYRDSITPLDEIDLQSELWKIDQEGNHGGAEPLSKMTTYDRTLNMFF